MASRSGSSGISPLPPAERRPAGRLQSSRCHDEARLPQATYGGSRLVSSLPARSALAPFPETLTRSPSPRSCCNRPKSTESSPSIWRSSIDFRTSNPSLPPARPTYSGRGPGWGTTPGRFASRSWPGLLWMPAHSPRRRMSYEIFPESAHIPQARSPASPSTGPWPLSTQTSAVCWGDRSGRVGRDQREASLGAGERRIAPRFMPRLEPSAHGPGGDYLRRPKTPLPGLSHPISLQGLRRWERCDR